MPSPPRSSSNKRGAGKSGKPAAKVAKLGVSSADAALNDWSSLMGKPGGRGGMMDAGAGGPGGKANNFVSLLDANALKGVKGKGKGKGGKGKLFGAGGDAEGPGDDQCVVCLVSDGSVYPPFPRCEISIAALAAIARYHLSKPKKVKPKKGASPTRSSSSPRKRATSPSAAGGEDAQRLKAPTAAKGASAAAPADSTAPTTAAMAPSDAEIKQAQPDATGGEDVEKSGTFAASPTSRKAGQRASVAAAAAAAAEEDEEEVVVIPPSSMAHLFYCLTCRCLYDANLNGWMPHRVCERCLYCTHGYCDVRTLELGPTAPTVCKDGLSVPQTYGEIRAQADQRIHWVIPLQEADVLQGRPLLLPPEARDFKSAMRRNAGGGGDGEGANLQQISPGGLKEFDYDEAFRTAVSAVLVHSEEQRRKMFQGIFLRRHMQGNLELLAEFGASFAEKMSKSYLSQAFMLQEKCRIEAKKLRTTWQEHVSKEIKVFHAEVDEFPNTIADERNASFDEIYCKLIMSRNEMVRKFPSMEVFEMAHDESMARSSVLYDEDNMRWIMGLVTITMPKFVSANCELRRQAVISHQERQREFWKDMVVSRIQIGAEKLFDEYRFRQFVSASIIYRLLLQFEAERDKITLRDGAEKDARVSLRYAALASKLQAIESEKRRVFLGQRMTFMSTMINAREGELRSVLAQLFQRDLSQQLSKLRKQAKAEGLFPDLKKLAAEAEAALMSQMAASGTFRYGKGKLIIPNIPYKKPAHPVPAAPGFINDIQNSLARNFGPIDDVVILDDGRLGLVAAPDDREARNLAVERVTASFHPTDSKTKGGVSVVRGNARPPLYGVKYINPDDCPPPDELKEENIIQAAGAVMKKMRQKRRGATNKKDDFDPVVVRQSPPLAMNALSLIGEVALSLKDTKEQQLAWTIHLQPSKRKKKLQAAVGILGALGMGQASTTSPSSSPSPAATGKPAGTGKKMTIAAALAAAATGGVVPPQEGEAAVLSPRQDSPSGGDSPSSAALGADEADAGTVDRQLMRAGSNGQTNLAINDGDDDEDNDAMMMMAKKEPAARKPMATFLLEAEENDAVGGTTAAVVTSNAQLSSSSFGPIGAGIESFLVSENSGQISPRPSSAAVVAGGAGAPAAASSSSGGNSPPNAQQLKLTRSPSSLPLSPSSPALVARASSGLPAATAARYEQMQREALESMAPGKMTQSQTQQFLANMVDRTILSCNAQGRPVMALIDDEIYSTFFLNSIRREEAAVHRGKLATDELVRSAMARLCVPPSTRSKRERKPAWVDARAAELFRAAEVPPLPPPPPPPPKVKPKPKAAAAAKPSGDKQRPGSSGGDDEKRKKKVKFTEDGEELEFTEDGAKKIAAKPGKKTGPKTDPALLAAMNSAQSQREMMRMMSLAAAGEDGADMESAAFAMGLHDGGGGEDGEAGSAFSLLLAQALDDPKSKKGSKRNTAAAAASGRRKAGRHQDYM